MGSYYDGEALGTLQFNTGGVGDAACALVGTTTVCEEADNDGYILQGGYTFNGTTKVGISYGESNEKATGATKLSNSLWTVGVYHDVNSWLKLTTEFSKQDSATLFGGGDVNSFSVGGFLLW